MLSRPVTARAPIPMTSVPKMPAAIFKRLVFGNDERMVDDDDDDDDDGGDAEADDDAAGPGCISGGINGSDGDAGAGDEIEEDDSVCSWWHWVESLSCFWEVCITTRRHGGEGKAGRWQGRNNGGDGDGDGGSGGAMKRDRWGRMGDAICRRTATTLTNSVGRSKDDGNVGSREVSDFGALIMISLEYCCL